MRNNSFFLLALTAIGFFTIGVFCVLTEQWMASGNRAARDSELELYSVKVTATEKADLCFTNYKVFFAVIIILHELADGAAGVFSAPTVYGPIALAVDGAADFVITFYKLNQISNASNAAKAKCVCPPSID